MDESLKQEIEDFIREFSDCAYTFTHGLCFWFAWILAARFDVSRLMYSPVDNHFMAEIAGRMYDATGDVTEEYPGAVPWFRYSAMEPTHAKRIIADCVRKERRKVDE